MTDLPSLAATLLANFATVRVPRHEGLWASPVADPSPSPNLLSIAVAGESLILRCYRQWLHYRLLEEGYRAFFDRVEGGGPDGWRLHFFCLNPSALSVLRRAGVGEIGPGDPVRFNPEAFVLWRLRQMERTGHLARRDSWWDWDSWIE
jgi:hypothetical protein